jgi:hypothetical protein
MSQAENEKLDKPAGEPSSEPVAATDAAQAGPWDFIHGLLDVGVLLSVWAAGYYGAQKYATAMPSNDLG